MRVVGTTLLVVAVLAAGPSASVAQAPPPSDPVGEILDAPAARRAGPAPAHPPSFASRVTGGAGETVRAMLPAILWALAGIAALAVGLAVNAYWQSRRREALEEQRAELLDDIGLLSLALLPAMPDDLAGLAVSAAYRPADGPAGRR